MSNYKNDKRAEEELGKFMDRYLYKLMCGIGNITGFDRIEVKDLQKLGIDVTVHTKMKDFYFDEKSTLQYINRNIPTFAFELCYSGNTGWFLKDGLMTDIYCLIWPNAITDDLSKIQCYDFTSAEVMLVHKERLQKYIFNIISKQSLLNSAFDAAAGTLSWDMDEKGRYHMPGNPSLYLVATKHLSEKPVNLAIKRNILRNFCTREFTVTKDTVRFKK